MGASVNPVTPHLLALMSVCGTLLLPRRVYSSSLVQHSAHYVVTNKDSKEQYALMDSRDMAVHVCLEWDVCMWMTGRGGEGA